MKPAARSYRNPALLSARTAHLAMLLPVCFLLTTNTNASQLALALRVRSDGERKRSADVAQGPDLCADD